MKAKVTAQTWDVVSSEQQFKTSLLGFCIGDEREECVKSSRRCLNNSTILSFSLSLIAYHVLMTQPGLGLRHRLS